ncbi:MAG: hypothetical protein OXF07_11145 [Rhodobacter sp.]|nr:hypothetical protein [Rhodobacter sp.]MCY4168100.1 hypothetical protein [Rhodobacter sp.]
MNGQSPGNAIGGRTADRFGTLFAEGRAAVARTAYFPSSWDGRSRSFGVVENGYRRFGPWPKRSGARRSQRGANAMLALKGRVMNLRLPDFLEWRANQAAAA